jgi:hypothetical protein
MKLKITIAADYAHGALEGEPVGRIEGPRESCHAVPLSSAIKPSAKIPTVVNPPIANA